MSGETTTAASTPARAGGAWEVRAAGGADVEAVAAGVRELLLELDGTPPAPAAMEDATRALIGAPAAGVVLVAQAGGELVGLLAASWQLAIHAPGEYALIQDLWVRREWRGQRVGRALLEALFALARERGAARAEVGLPRESFAGFPATEAFYLARGFTHNGPRMRRALA